MVVATGTLQVLGVLGVLAGVSAFAYFLFRGMQSDHETGEYHFTWGVGVVVLFLLGLAPGFVGVGLYLTVERGYPTYWLVACLLVVVAILVLAGLGAGSVATPAASLIARGVVG